MELEARLIPPGQRQICTQVFDESDRESLRARLTREGYEVLSIQSPRSVRRMVGNIQWSRPVRIDVTWWAREVLTLIRAGMTVVEAIETLSIQRRSGGDSSIHEALLERLRMGKSLSQAMRSTECFPPILIAGVAASERTSNLNRALEDFLQYDEHLKSLRSQAVGAAIYPAIVASLGTVIGLFLLVYVLPRFAKMYGSFRGSPSFTTQLMIQLSAAIRDHQGALYGALSSLIVVAIVIVRTGRFSAWGKWLLFHTPFIRDATHHFVVAQVYQALSLTFRGGYTLMEAMEVCRQLPLGVKLKDSLNRAALWIEKGQGVGESFFESGLADDVDRRLLAVGERTGQFDDVLDILARRHAQVFSQFVQRASRLLEPVFLLLVALIVGGMVVMMYMPIFDIANSIQ